MARYEQHPVQQEHPPTSDDFVGTNSMKQMAAIALLLVFALIVAEGCDAQASPPAGGAQDPRLADAQQAIGKKDFEGAAALISDYLKSHPDDANAHFQLAFSYDSLKRMDQAIPEYRRAIEIDPALFPAHMNLGLALLERKDPAAAAIVFQRASELLPDQAKPRYFAGLALERSGDLKGALAQYEQAASLDEKSFDTFFHWGMILLRSDRPADAEIQLRRALALSPDSGPALDALTNALLAQKKTGAAVAELSAHLQRVPGDVEARTRLAETLYDLAKYSDALEELDRADAIAPPSTDRLKLRASIYISQEKWDAAAQILAPLISTSPNDAELHAELGNILLHKRDFPAAERELRRALALDDKPITTMKNLMSTVYLAGNYTAALDLLDQLAKREPPTAFVFFIRATCYDKLQRKAEAVEAYRKFLAAEQSENRKNDKEEFQATERLKLLQRELSKK